MILIYYIHNYISTLPLILPQCMLLLINRPPVREVCPNHRVVLFQPWTGTSLEPGSVIIANLLLVSPVPPVSTLFWIFFPPPWASLLPSHNMSPFDYAPLLSVVPTSSPDLAQDQIVHPPGHRPHPPDSTAHAYNYQPCRPQPADQVRPGPWSPAPLACGCHLPRPLASSFSP